MFRKKPVVIEARLWGGSGAGAAVLQEWMSEFDRQSRVDLDDNGAPTFEIYTLEGWHYASSGDWIIRGVAGEFYPCKPAIFAATYDAVSGDETGDSYGDSPDGHVTSLGGSNT